MDLTIHPAASLTWAYDVAGNVVTTAMFHAMTDRLSIECESEVEIDAAEWPVFPVDVSAIFYPFQYSASELTDLGSLIAPQYPDPGGRLRSWSSAFVRSNPTDTLALLKDINAGVTGWINYQDRDDEGTQSPLQTIDRGWGSCRDMAVLFIEAVRTLGFGARIVSGYLHNPSRESVGSTHAWAEVYVPGAGWISFDPTNRSVGSVNLIPVAVGRGIDQVMPVVGAFNGMTDAFNALTVEVAVRSAT